MTTHPLHPNHAIALPVPTAVPPFTLHDTDGRPYSPTQLPADKPLILVFYRGDWCPYCQLQMHQLSQVYEQIVRGAQTFGLSLPKPKLKTKLFAPNATSPFLFWEMKR